MNEVKYVIFRIGSPALYYYKACVFNGMLVHSLIAQAHAENGLEVWSAGFCTITVGSGLPKVVCYGKSESLKMESNPEFDSQVIKETLFPHVFPNYAF